MNGRIHTISARLVLLIVLLFLIATAGFVLIVRDTIRVHVLDDARKRADLLIGQSLATHSYINQELKPELFDLAAAVLDEDAFTPSWMSSTYAIRRIGTYADSEALGYYYKECAIDARSPENEADGYEAEFLRELNSDPGLDEWSGSREVDGTQVFYLLKRGETMEEPCLRCHSTPEAAPAQLVEYYGPDRSFGRQAGDVVSALSIRIPLEVAYAEADRVAWQLTILLLGLLLGVLSVLYVFMRREVVRPLALVADNAAEMVAGTRGLSEGVGVSSTTEIGEVGAAIDALAAHLDRRISELVSAYHDLEAANTTRDRFLTNLSHELRTPLNSIIGFAGTLRSGLAGPVSEEQEKQLAMIGNSGRHLLALVQELLEYSAIYAGAERVTVTRFKPCEAVVGVVQMFRPAAELKGLAIEMGECPHDREVATDRFKLEQMLINLVGNAVKFTDAGRVTLSSAAVGDDLLIMVSDTGPGIDPEHLEAVFEEFYQASIEPPMRPAGTGLGLTIARAHARLLGGDIDVESEVGAGTTFTIRIPLEYSEPSDERTDGSRA